MTRKNLIILISALAVCALALGGVFAVGALRSQAPTEPREAFLSSAAPAEASLDDPAGTWTVSAGSEAGYRVDEVLNGDDVTVVGRTSEVSGSFEADALSLLSGRVEVDTGSISTDNGSRDNYFRGIATRNGAAPTAVFTLDEPVLFPETGNAMDDVYVETASGTLEIAGVSQPVTVQLEITPDGDAVRVAGSVPMTFADYGIEAPSLGFVRVEPEGLIEFLLVLTR